MNNAIMTLDEKTKNEYELIDFNNPKSHCIFEFEYNGAIGQIVLLWHLLPASEPRFNGYATFKKLDDSIDYESSIDIHGGITFQENNTLGYDHFHLSDKNHRDGLDFKNVIKEICSLINQVNELHK